MEVFIRAAHQLCLNAGYRLVAREESWGQPGVLYFRWEKWS